MSDRPKRQMNPIAINDQIGCGYCKFEKLCKPHWIIRQNKEAFAVNGITTYLIAENCTNFKHFNL
jgi:hypothetical protein